MPMERITGTEAQALLVFSQVHQIGCANKWALRPAPREPLLPRA